MENLGATITKGTQNLVSNWTSYTVLGSFLLYVFGYLVLRFHLTVLGVGTDLSVIDERYLFAGAKFLIFLVSSVPSLLLLFLFLAIAIYLPFRILPVFLRTKVCNFFYHQWQKVQSWWLISNRLAWLGIIFSLFIIQFVMRQCFLLSDLLLAEDLLDKPVWLRYLLLNQYDEPLTLYFFGLLVGVFLSLSLYLVLRNLPNQTISSRYTRLLLGFLLSVQLLLMPVNYGALVHDKFMPQVTGLAMPGTLEPDEQAWLVWEGREGKTFLLRTNQDNKYHKKLVTLSKTDVQKLEITGYDSIIKYLFGDMPPKSNLKREGS